MPGRAARERRARGDRAVQCYVSGPLNLLDFWLCLRRRKIGAMAEGAQHAEPEYRAFGRTLGGE